MVDFGGLTDMFLHDGTDIQITEDYIFDHSGVAIKIQ